MIDRRPAEMWPAWHTPQLLELSLSTRAEFTVTFLAGWLLAGELLRLSLGKDGEECWQLD